MGSLDKSIFLAALARGFKVPTTSSLTNYPMTSHKKRGKFKRRLRVTKRTEVISKSRHKRGIL